MTVHKELQALIVDIESVLSASRSGTDGSKVDALAQSHRVLEQVRDYLVTLPPAAAEQPQGIEGAQWQEQVAGAIAQGAIAQMNLQRATWLQPWQMELEAVRQQRDALHREIQQLEGQRQNLVADFLQVLMNRISTTVEHHVTQALETVETRFLYAAESLAGESEEDSALGSSVPGNPAQRLEQLKQLDRQSDRLLTTLDTTFREVFETLEQDLQGYQDALSASVRRMYDLGSQGEGILTEYADSPTSPEPPAAVDPGEAGSPPPTEPEAPAEPPSELPATEPSSPQPDPAQFYLFPGAEIPVGDREIVVSPPPPPEPEPPQTSVVESMSDAQIDTLLEKIDASEAELTPPPSESPVEQAELEKWDEVLFGSDSSSNTASPDPEESDIPTPPEAADANPPTTAAMLFGSEGDPAQQLNPPPKDNLAAIAVDIASEFLAPSRPTPAAEENSLPPESSSEPLPPGDRIESLANLIEQAYSSHANAPSPDSGGDDYAPVQPGESLLNSGESESHSQAGVSPAFEQTDSEQLAEDLDRFQKGDCSEAASAPTESFSPPEELVGENYEQMPLENISVDSDLWKESSQEPATEETEEEDSSLPKEIDVDPWSKPAHQPPNESSEN